MGKYYLKDDAYIMEDFDKLPAFSSFLPGLAGVKGVPIWVYYTNRGQGINSFGIHNKNNAIMEFNPANTAYENTSIKGFRTFVKWEDQFFEPFFTFDPNAKRTFNIRKNSIWLEEVNTKYGLKFTVKYYVLPNDSVGALIRKVKVENIGKDEKQLEMLDGLPKIIPYGIANNSYKEMSNLLKSWTDIKNIENNAPFYTMRASTEDSEEFSDAEGGGYFYMAINEGKVLPVIYDAELIFNYDTSLVHPVAFYNQTLSELMKNKPCFYNKVPCGFTPLSFTLNPGESYVFHSLTGFAATTEQLNEKRKEFCGKNFFCEKEKQAEEIVNDLTRDIKTHTAVPVFDQYMEQNYLDNFLRGGYPIVFHPDGNKSVIHLFSRKHGDPERDYNFFSIAGEYYSQGNGNFRDVNQNRRNDVFFQKDIGDFNIKTFFGLIQADGYNPLEVRPSTFTVKPENKDKVKELFQQNIKQPCDQLMKLTNEAFTPGQIANYIATHGITVLCGEDQFLEQLLTYCDQNIEAGFGEGYWSDHWDYNMDLIDSYLCIFPDKEKEILFDDQSYRFYDSPARVLPRSEKYVITKKNEVRQYGALVHDEEKMNRQGFRKNGTNWLKTVKGDYVVTTLMGKLISLSLNKFSSLDAFGMGVEMEAGKPGWNDAMNGLPGLFGSGMAETFELKRMISFICNKVGNVKTLLLPTEISVFLTEVYNALQRSEQENWSDFAYWDTVSTLREKYRDTVRFTTSGNYQEHDTTDILKIYQAFYRKLEAGIQKACDLGNGIVPTYFTFRASKFEPVIDEEGNPVISHYGLPKAKVKAFEVQPLPPFLEGPVKMLASLSDPSKARELYSNVRNSDLFDQKLKMYKTSVSIEHIAMENGRIRAFTPGWLERESIFLHMEYKYLLSMLKAGLYDEFYEDIKTAMVVFRDPAEYGRSILENSSFIASSVNPNESIHGRGYVARLSGSTTEAISIWIEMFMGEKVFAYVDGELQLHFEPKLAGWMFDERGEVSFTFLKNCKVTYSNPSHKNTYGPDGAKVSRIFLPEMQEEITAAYIKGERAEQIRNGSVKEIIIELE
ncbi:cellobiose phosphorylase [Lachnospiraceae bacterium MD1]|uniref:Cellobiose phosphorylase n=1 Tax=Variimorphobacter saccharofermentans TaxID=2755051 RepID=A0A839K353_9FIRM|nr:cellobiose phosphorylase [Variimorphobacter saccharofermentans]MBB2184046.1 cellobiose phosphorylase [Variimorphobacter saccharofermentans]